MKVKEAKGFSALHQAQNQFCNLDSRVF